MQNTPQTFRGAPAPGVNFADHSYDNHVGVHCQPSGYQPYPNQPYHPLPSPRPHHYANHQMQQNMPYRHPGGAYAPNQNQYGSNINQDIYRNHSGYAGGNNRNMSSKPWTETNSSAEMMPPYSQVSHSQMMNNPPPQMPVSTMRSPPHATSNINPAPPQGQQHYRQMQSPAHSPHSWSQAQIPSPGVMHSSRTTPSPLPTHVRSPGHSQPFSPPTAHAMNIQPHPQPPENGQIPQSVNSTGGNDSQNPNNPLHSLQKMVMLDQDSKAMIPMMGDGNDQYTNHCGSHNYVPEECVNNESKDSVYSTYYNMDENRFESKPSGSGNNSYPNVQQVSNCNFPVPPHLINSDEVQSNQIVPNSSSNVSECIQSDQNSLISPGKNPISSVAHSKTQNIGQNDCTAGLTECPPHAESAPMFTDQTKAAVSTNSEQALESKSSVVVKSDPDKKLSIGSPNTNTVINLDSSVSAENLSKDSEIGVSMCDSQNQSNEMSSIDEQSNSSETNSKSNVQVYNESQSGIDKSHGEINNSSKDDNISKEKGEIAGSSSETHVVNQNPSTAKISNEDNKLTVEEVKSDSSYTPNAIKEEVSDDVSKVLGQCNVPASKEEATTAENNPKLSHDENLNSSNDSKTLLIDKVVKSDSNHDPVKVVIHRIRKDNTNDTWHVPANNNSELSANVSGSNSERKTESKLPNVGPQIVILSPATSERKFGFHSSVDENSVITVKEEKEDEGNDVVIEKTESNSSANGSIKNEPGSSNSSFRRSPDKKRGRPVGSKNKIKPGNSTKKKKGKRGNKRKKFDSSKLKTPEALPKIKKIKVFNGPYVHIIGSKENPSSISVVNVAQKEEEKISKVPVKRNFNNTVNRIKKKPVGHLSTLSPTYDAFNRDKTWLCIFCHKGSHHSGLGDLYGPYYIKDKNYGNSKSSTPSTSTSSARTKKRKSDHEENRASKRSKQTAGHSVTESTPICRSSENTSDTDSDLRETWIHEDCAVWCQSISLMGEEVQGLEEAVTDAYENKCCQCSLTGATLGCWGKGCKELYHFSCAKEIGCQMDIEKFSLLCPKHQKRSPDRHNRCQ